MDLFLGLCSVVQLEVKDGNSSRSSYIVQDCFGFPVLLLLGFFVLFCFVLFCFVLYEVENCAFKDCKELC